MREIRISPTITIRINDAHLARVLEAKRNAARP